MEQSSNSASTSNPHTDANTSYESRATSPPPQESIAERLASRLGSLSLTKHKLKPKSRSKSSGERHTGETSPTSPTTSTSAGSSNAIRAQGSYDVFSDLPPVPASYERELPPPPLAVAAAPYPADYAAAVMRPPPPPANNLQHDNDSTPTAEFTFAQAAAGTNVDNIASGNEHSSNHQVSGASQQLRTPQTTSLPRLPPRPDSSGSNSSTRGDQSSLLPLSAPGRSSNFYYPSSTVSTPTTAAATVHAHAQGSGLARVHSVSPPNNARAHLVPSNYQSGLRARPASSVELQTSSSSAGTSYPTPNYMDSINGPPPLQSAPAPRPVSYVSSPTGGITENQFTPASSSSSNEPRMIYCHCAFCNGELKYYDTSPCFSCTICDTVNDLEIHVSTRHEVILQQTTPLAVDWLQAGPGDDETDFARRIYFAFACWDILNASFSNGRESTVADTGLSMDEVRQGYRIIMSQSRPIIRSMMSGIDKLLRRIGRPIRTPKELKFVMILLENPVLNASSYHPKEAEQRHAIQKRLFGLIGHMENGLHHCLVSWFSQLPKELLLERVEMINRFITFRLQNQDRSKIDSRNFASYDMDWPTAAAARVMALLFSANKLRPKIELHEFYNTLADYIDLQRDFDLWRRTLRRFCFCQYPFLLSIGARMRIMEVEAQRQMQHLADSAVYRTICGNEPTVPYLVLRVRREYLIEDSLNQLANLRQDFKKKLRIEFIGEMGVDAGGLTKEWFLLLVRELFSPDYGMFTCDEDSGLIWFNPASFETSDQYYLVGVIIGLAIYNSIILDIRLPLACYKKLLGASVGMNDLAQFRPVFANSLRQLMEYKGDDVEEVFMLDFVATYEAFGETQSRPLVPDGENKPVTRRNRREYVERYIDFILNSSINNQFVEFKRGFDEVCDGATIKLFRPEEIELVVRGSAESLQLTELRAVTVYDGFRHDEQIINDFWHIFMSADPTMQRRILFFITGSDRVPATGMSNMAFKITCIGSDCERFPQAHTCFNQLCLYRYRSRQKLYDKLITAVMESEGYGLK